MNGVVGLSHYVYHFYVVIYGLCKGQKQWRCIAMPKKKDTKVEALRRLHNQLPSNPMNISVADIKKLEKAQNRILKRKK